MIIVAGHRHISIARYTIGQFRFIMECATERTERGLIIIEESVMFDGQEVSMGRGFRLKTFYRCGVVCCRCGLAGTHFRMEKTHYSDKRFHLNLYAPGTPGEPEILMTVDHIRPRSKGGGNGPDNLRVMCGPCNFRRGAGDGE